MKKNILKNYSIFVKHPKKEDEEEEIKFFFDLFTSFSDTTGSEWPKNKNKFSTIVIQNRTRKYKSNSEFSSLTVQRWKTEFTIFLKTKS